MYGSDTMEPRTVVHKSVNRALKSPCGDGLTQKKICLCFTDLFIRCGWNVTLSGPYNDDDDDDDDNDDDDMSLF